MREWWYLMAGRSSRQKGKRGEREVAHLFTDRGYQARRGDSQSRGAREADVEDTKWWIEVKRGKCCPIRRGIAQMEGDTDGRATLLFWRDDRSDWRIDMSADTFFEILASCGPGEWVVPYEPNQEDSDGYSEDQGKD
jgi:hypothetical protein